MNEEKEGKWYHHPWAVIVLIFLVLGPFGLPLLFKSPKFNRAWKVIVTLLTILYTGYLVVATLQVIQAVSAQFVQLKTLL